MPNVMVLMLKILIGRVQDGTELSDKQGLNLVKHHMIHMEIKEMEITGMHATPTRVAGLLEVIQVLLEKQSLGQYVIQKVAEALRRLLLK